MIHFSYNTTHQYISMNIMYIILKTQYNFHHISVDAHDKFSHVESGQAAQQAGQWLDVEARRKCRWVVVGCVGVVAE